jgi:trehalose/maltose transport system permease protein
VYFLKGVLAVAQATSAPAPKRAGQTSELARAEARTAYWLLLPTFTIMFLVAIYPLAQVIYLSFTNARFADPNAETSFVGFSNYRDLLSFTIVELPQELDDNGQQVIEDGEPQYESAFRTLPREPRRFSPVREFNFGGKHYVLGASNADFIRSVGDTVFVTVIAVALEALLGLAIALVLSAKFWARGAMRAAMLVPWAIITVVSTRIWEWMLVSDRKGFFNAFLNRLGLSDGFIDWTGNPALQVPNIIAMEVWKTTPFMALLLLAGLATIPGDLYEAAEIDGASKVQQFFSMTLPLLTPTLAVALVFRTLDSLRIFEAFQIMYGESRQSMSSFAYFQLISAREMGFSSATSVVIFLLLFIFAFLYIRMLKVDTE